MMRLETRMKTMTTLKTAAASVGVRPQKGLTAIGLFLSVFVLAGCSGLMPDKPQRPLMYDFGPGALSAKATPAASPATLPPLSIGEITTSGGAIDNMAVLYRLGYDDAQHLRQYSLARWSMPAAQLVRQRLLSQLGQNRAVFNAGSSAALERSNGLPLRLRIELEEFSQLFTAPDASVGLVRLRATLVEVSPAGERLVGQRSVLVQHPASSADAPGGVRALTAATDTAIEELNDWLQQVSTR